MQSLEQAVEDGKFVEPEDHIGGLAYGLGKLGGTTIYPRVLAKRLCNSHYVTSCCPAFGGADTPVWLATAPLRLVGKGHGGFWEQRELTNCENWRTGMQCTFAKTGKYPLGCE
jgi:hypothetical protein